MNKHFFLVLEGLDCSGKTYLLNSLRDKIEQNQKIKNFFNSEIVFTYEPGGKDLDIANKIRSYVFENKDSLSKFAEVLLIFASRAEHLDKLLIPTIKQGGLIICDRYFLSTLVYQGVFGEISRDWLQGIMDVIAQNYRPTHTIFLNINQDVYLERFKKKKASKDFNSFDTIYDNYQKMYASYLECIAYLRSKNEKITFVSTSNAVDQNVDFICELINSHIDQYSPK